MKYILVHASSGKVSFVIVLVLGLVEVHPTINFSCETHFVSSKKYCLVLFDHKGHFP